jgi:hypothetical protein
MITDRFLSNGFSLNDNYLQKLFGLDSSADTKINPQAEQTSQDKLLSEQTTEDKLKNTPTALDLIKPTTSEHDKTYIEGIDQVPSYRGDLPSPLQVMWYVPENSELLKVHYSDSEIRSWVKDAAEYNDVPHELMAVVLQQENAPNVSKWHQFLQFGERSATTLAAIVDKYTFDIVPDEIAGGSSGIANMKRATLENAANYIESTYNRAALPEDVRYRVLGWDQDNRIPGDDLKADLYYASGELRRLIDRKMGTGYTGPLTLEQTNDIIASYNGSGPLAEKYGNDAINTLNGAADGTTPLYFYEK